MPLKVLRDEYWMGASGFYRLPATDWEAVPQMIEGIRGQLGLASLKMEGVSQALDHNFRQFKDRVAAETFNAVESFKWN